jgi:hypothetical protein
MAKSVITGRYVSLAGTEISSNLAGVSLELTAEEIDSTSLGSAGWREIQSGLKSGSITFNFMQDYGAGGIDSLLYPLLGTNATVVVRAGTGTASATNPAYTAVVVVSNYVPVSGSIGDLDTFDITLPTTGAVTRATA